MGLARVVCTYVTAFRKIGHNAGVKKNFLFLPTGSLMPDRVLQVSWRLEKSSSN